MSDIIGRRYAKALLLSLVPEGGKLDDNAKKLLANVENELSALGALITVKGSDFRHAMLNPSFSGFDRLSILEDIAKENGFQSATRVMIRLLVSKERVPYLQSIATAFRTEVDVHLGRVRATITAAKKLDDNALKDVVNVLGKRTGKTVLADVNVDEDVISGISAQIGGLVFDGTLRAQLDRLSQNLSL
ncbi:MAG: ATP synthase F1 subunit delta [Deltaproteobacteria bacterium]|nr:ATP synthase F1 subunit delta [Deltaproteobacteria bacterium]